MFTKLAIWFLQKKKVSVIIGFTIEGKEVKAKSKYNDTYTYDNELRGVDYYTTDDRLLVLPEGKFSIKR